MLVWVIIAIVIAFSFTACIATIMIGAKRAPKKALPPYLPLHVFVALFMVWGVEWIPMPPAVDLAARLIGGIIGVGLIYYYGLYRSGAWLKDFYGKLIWRKQ